MDSSLGVCGATRLQAMSLGQDIVFLPPSVAKGSRIASLTARDRLSGYPCGAQAYARTTKV
jgi:hypothetical protein